MPLHEQMLTTRSTYRESLVEHLFLGGLVAALLEGKPVPANRGIEAHGGRCWLRPDPGSTGHREACSVEGVFPDL